MSYKPSVISDTLPVNFTNSNKNDEVTEFMTNRFKYDCEWKNGNCYFFACILKERFPKGKIVYDLINCHFMFQLKNYYYDWINRYEKDEFPDTSIVIWNKYKSIDPTHYNRINRQVIIHN